MSDTLGLRALPAPRPDGRAGGGLRRHGARRLRPRALADPAALFPRLSGHRERALPDDALLGRPDAHERDRSHLDDLPLRSPPAPARRLRRGLRVTSVWGRTAQEVARS